MPTELSTHPTPAISDARRPESIILVYDADSGFLAMLADVLKKAIGREDCALCSITHGPTGKRSAWRKCEVRLGIAVRELHRDEVPEAWGLSRAELPCIVGLSASEDARILVSRDQIHACGVSSEALERAIQDSLLGHPGSMGKRAGEMS